MTYFVCLVGLPGSGKSFYAKELASQYDAEIFSSDSLREELFNDVNFQGDNNALFKELHRRIKECLKSGKSAIYDATNINMKKRKAFLDELKNISCKKICCLMATPYKVCLERNAQRERKVPEEVITRMYKNFNVPFWYEGWDFIDIIYSEESENSFGMPREWIESVMDFNQDNPNHSLTLGEHCRETWYCLQERINYDDDFRSCCITELKYAALLHDEGKVFTKGFVDSKGNPSETAHYYQHQNCSAYDSLFFEYPANHLYVAQLVQQHMRPFIAWKYSQKAMEKDKKLLGENFFRNLCYLHEADKAAH